MLSLYFLESLWVVLSRKKSEIINSGTLGITISLVDYWMCCLNRFWTHSEAMLQKLQVIREWSYDALVGHFWKLMDNTFQEKSEQNYFRHSGYRFGRYWMCWLNWFWIVILLQCHSEPNLWKTLRKLGGKLQYFRWTFLKANGQYFARKNQEHYFRYSDCLFGRHWMCWLNRFQNTFGNAFIPKYALPQLVLRSRTGL